VTGWVGQEKTYDAADLATFPQTTVADTFLSGGGSTSRNYTGVDMWRLLGLPESNGIGSLILPNDPPGPQGPSQRNDITRYSVLVTATDCHQALFSMAEITPFFGGKPVVVATAQGDYDPTDLTPVTESLGDSGFARISNPVDIRGSRRVSNIVDIRVLKAPAVASVPPSGSPECTPGQSDELKITGWVNHEETYDAARLADLPQSTVADTYLSGMGSTSRNYTGVDLWRLLGLSANSSSIGSLIKPNLPGPQYPEAQHNDLTRYSVMVTGADCFQALFSLAEISPFFGGKPVVVATAQGDYDPNDLTPVTESLDESGFARISNPVDIRGSRRVSNLVQIEVFPTPTPEITWSTPTPITAGTALSEKQLNATASESGVTVPGTFTYDPPAGTVLPVGKHTLTTLFVPSTPSSTGIARSVVTLEVTQTPPPPAPAATSLTITLNPQKVTAGQAVTTSATLTGNGTPVAGASLTLYRKASESTLFKAVGEAVTDATGKASLKARPLRHATYLWRYAGSAQFGPSVSASRQVAVKTKVTIKRPERVRPGALLVIKGRAKPAAQGVKAKLWYLKNGQAVRLATGKVLAGGKIRLTTTLSRTGNYRVFITVNKTPTNLKGTSPTRVVKVRS